MISEWRRRDRFLSACIAWVPGVALAIVGAWLWGREEWWKVFSLVSFGIGISLIGGGFKIYADRTHPDDEVDDD